MGPDLLDEAVAWRCGRRPEERGTGRVRAADVRDWSYRLDTFNIV
ncbi:hypothetical protein ACGFY7_09860 [Streptomyces prunicolor]